MKPGATHQACSLGSCATASGKSPLISRCQRREGGGRRGEGTDSCAGRRSLLPLILLLRDQARLFKQVFFNNSSVIKGRERVKHHILVLFFLKN